MRPYGDGDRRSLATRALADAHAAAACVYALAGSQPALSISNSPVDDRATARRHRRDADRAARRVAPRATFAHDPEPDRDTIERAIHSADRGVFHKKKGCRLDICRIS